jgi:hypothetical protein
MRSGYVKKLSACLLALLLGVTPLMAFDTFDASWSGIAGYLFGKPFGFIHREITLRAIGPLGIKEGFQKQIAYWNWRPDWDETRKLPPSFLPNEYYDPAHHFDRNEIAAGPEKHAEAFIRGAKYAAQQRAIVVDGLKRQNGKDIGDSLQAIGRAFHALQDFFSHSNVVDLPEPEFRAVKKALSDASPPPAALKITDYDIERGGVAEGDDFSHDIYSKDDPKKNDEAQKTLEKTSVFYDAANPDKTKFEAARDAAADYSREWLESIRDEAGAESWSRLTE